MVLNFPNSPVDGEIFGSYVWDDSLGVWKKNAEVFVAAFSGTVPPENPNGNELWFNTSDGQFYIYYEDVDSDQWVQLSGDEGPMGPTGPTGEIGPTGPTGPSTELSLLEDVDLTGIGDYNLLRYDALDDTWKPFDNGIPAVKLNTQTIDQNYSIPSGHNGLSVGPITISSGFSVIIESGRAWAIL